MEEKFGKHFFKVFGATLILNSPEEVSVSAQFPKPQPKATYVNLPARNPENSPGLNQWDQDTTSSTVKSLAEGEEYLLLAVERFGDKIDLIEHMIGQYIEDLSATKGTENSIAPPGEAGSVTSEFIKILDRFEDRVSAQIQVLSDKILTQETQDVDRLADRFQPQLDRLSAQLDAFSSRPVIRPDLSAQHVKTAQIMTAVSTISRRQEAVMGQIEEHLAAFTSVQETMLSQNENIVASSKLIQQRMESRLQAIENLLGTLISDGLKNNKKLANFSRTAAINAKNLQERLDYLNSPVLFDPSGLETRLFKIIHEVLLKAHSDVADTEVHASLAPDLIRNLRFAVAEILAGAAQKNSYNTPSCTSDKTTES
jgi:HPt (histidine-containing phosphotransfer) domain-containing protein